MKKEILASIKPTKWKIIISIILTLIYLYLSSLTMYKCKTCLPEEINNCNINLAKYKLISNCDCCLTLKEILIQYFSYIILPFIIIYLLLSLIQLIKIMSKNG